MEPDDQEDESKERKHMLIELVRGAHETVIYAPDLSANVAASIADKIGDVANSPEVDQLAEIVRGALEVAGQGAGDAAEVAGDVAQAIIEGLGDLSSGV